MIEWFLATRVGRWLVGAGALLLAVGGALLAAFFKGKHVQAKADQAKAAQADIEAAKAAQHTYADASDAAKAVRQQAAAQAPPDTAKRDDFEGTF